MRYLILLVMLSSCVSIIDLDSVEPPQEHVGAWSERAVQIHAGCGDDADSYSGSGTIVDPHQILSAWHIVESCPDGALTATLADGIKIDISVRAASISSDMVLFQTNTDLGIGVQPTAKVYRGDVACMAAAYPKRKVLCGHVLAINRATDMFNGWISVTTKSGNSGAGVFNAEGELVGIVTHNVVLDGAQNGGVFTTVLR